MSLVAIYCSNSFHISLIVSQHHGVLHLQTISTSSPSSLESTSTMAMPITMDSSHKHELLIDMPSQLPEDIRLHLSNLQKGTRLTLSWASNICTTQVHRVRENGQLEEGNTHGEAVYRAKVLTTVLDQRASWLTPTARSIINSPFDLPKSELTPDVFNTYLSSLTPTPPPSSGAGKFLQQCTRSILSGGYKNGTTAHFAYSQVLFTYDRFAHNIDASIQVFEITLKATHFAKDMPAPEPQQTKIMSFLSPAPVVIDMITIEPIFSSVQYEFQSSSFKGLSSTVEKSRDEMAKSAVGKQRG